MEDEPRRGTPALAPTIVQPVVLPGTTTLSVPERKKLRELEGEIAAGIRSFRGVGAALLAIRDSRLYGETYSSFEAYCDEKWQLERARAYQFMSAATVMQAIPAEAGSMVTNEAQARALAPILRDRGTAGVEMVLQGIRDRGDPITAPLIRRVSDALMHPNAPAEPTVADRLVRDMGRLTTEYRQWLASGPSRKEKSTVKEAAAQLIQALS